MRTYGTKIASDKLRLLTVSSTLELPSDGRGAFLLWKSSTSNANAWPDAVLLSQHFKRDFLAWAHTYLTSHSPIGAFIHLLDDEFLPTFFGEQNYRSSGLERLIALPATESLTNIDAREDAIALPSVLCRSCSFAAIRAIAVGYNWDGVAKAIDNWGAIRGILSLPDAKIDASTMKLVFAVARAVGGDSNAERFVSKASATALRMVMEYATTGNISNLSWRALTARLPDAPSQTLLSVGPRESRVPLVQKLLEGAFEVPDRDHISVACFLGYVINQLASGTLEHTNILRRLSGTHPSALLWYGLFAGLHKNGGLKGYFSTSGAAMLRREINRPAVNAGPPACDITADELFMIYEANKNSPRLRGLVPNQITISVLPGVDVPIRTMAKEQLAPSSSLERSSVDLRVNNFVSFADSKLAETTALVDSLRAKLRELLALSDLQRNDRGAQPQLFSPPSDSSTRRSKKSRAR